MPDIIKVKDTRRAFVETLNEIADQRTVVIIPDVGFLYLDDPANKFRVINTGAMEQHATIFATALALDGWRVFLYSMIPFVLFRNGEQCRTLVAHNAPVTLLGVQGGPSYRFLGTGHNLLHDKEDFNFCDNISLKWYHPKSNEEVRAAVIESFHSDKPRYIRL